jgi:hypothetical protein
VHSLTNPNYRSQLDALPPLCATCRLASWTEEGLLCHDPRAMDLRAFYLNDEGKVQVDDDSGERLGDIEWSGVCDNYVRGTPAYGTPEGPWYEAILDQVKAIHFPSLLDQRSKEMNTYSAIHLKDFLS